MEPKQMELTPQQLRQRSALFSNLDDKDIQAVLSLAHPEQHAAKQVLFREGEEGDRLLVLLEGRVKVSLGSPEGKEAILSILEPGQLIGEMSLLDGGSRSATVTTMDACRFMVIWRKDFVAFLEQHPRVALALLHALSLRLRATNDMVGNLSFLNLPARLARILLNLGQQYGKHSGEGVVIGLKLSQEELGNLVGVSRESVNRQVRMWVESGVLDYAHGTMILKNSDALFREALSA
jgi:CRP/FNR family transcriptional regulator, cyclic AMP receptor protein